MQALRALRPPPARPAQVPLPRAGGRLERHPRLPGAREELNGGDAGFKRLGPAQLLRHILGLRFGAPVDKVRLVYLYVDAPGDEAAEHRAEIRRFQERIADDPVWFMPMTVQEFILRAVDQCREEHEAYVDYLAERYL